MEGHPMKRARTFTRAEMADAARLAAEHGLTLRLQRDGDIVMAPQGTGLDTTGETSAESALAEWKARRGKAPGRAHH
jgi:hypothetical protein